MNSLFRRENSLFAQKNSLFRPAQGIRLQHIEIAKESTGFAESQGIGLQRIEMTAGIGARKAEIPRIRKNSLLNSLYSGNLSRRNRRSPTPAVDV
jgi:hypothetical protein